MGREEWMVDCREVVGEKDWDARAGSVGGARSSQLGISWGRGRGKVLTCVPHTFSHSHTLSQRDRQRLANCDREGGIRGRRRGGEDTSDCQLTLPFLPEPYVPYPTP